MKVCLMCAEEVQDLAKICRFCNHSFTDIKKDSMACNEGDTNSQLGDGERIEFYIKKSKIIYIIHWVGVVFWFMLSIVFFSVGDAGMFGLFCLMFALISFYLFLQHFTYNASITTRDITLRTGVIFKSEFKILLNKIESVNVTDFYVCQSVRVTGTGISGMTMTWIENGKAFKDVILHLKSNGKSA